MKAKLLDCLLLALLFVSVFPAPASAVELQGLGVDVVSISNVSIDFAPLATYTPSELMTTVLNIMLGIAGVASFFMLLWGGLQWILAGGDKEGTEKARKRITSALVGLTIVFSAYALMYILRVLFNINLIQVSLKPIGT